MESSTTVASESIAVHVTEDGLRAYVQFATDSSDSSATEADVIAALVEAEIAIDDDVRHRVHRCVQRHESGEVGDATDADETEGSDGSSEAPMRFLVAKGRPAIDGIDEAIEWAEEFQTAKKSWEGDGAVDFYSFNQIVTVGQDAVFGVVTPLVPPEDGVDVRGHEIKGQGDPQRLQVDETVQRAEGDLEQLIAKVPGRVTQDGNRLTIEEVVHIDGDLGFNTGNLTTPANVHVAGAIPDRFEVRSARGVVVESVIEAAHVWASDDVVVRGGIVGRHAGRVCAGGDVIAKFLSEADVAAGCDISVSKQIMASRLFAGAKLVAPQCAIVGGQVYALKSADIHTLGNDSDPPTSITVGCNLEVLKECVALEACMKVRKDTETRIRAIVKSILEGGKVIAKQRQRASQLIREADQLAKQVSENQRQFEKCLEKIVEEEGAYVIVNSRIYRNASITIGRRMTVFERELGGPVLIETRQIKNVTQMVAVNRLTSSIKLLKSYKQSDETLYENFKTDILPRDGANG